MSNEAQGMLKKGCVDDIKSGALTRSDGYLVLTMCHYPRGLSKKVVDEYVKAVAPDKKLLDDFHAERERLGGNHNAAFLSCHYQERFTLDTKGIAELARLSALSADKDVYCVCQCNLNQRCHRELLLIAARKWFNAKTELRKFSYPIFEARLGDIPGFVQTS